MFKRQDKKLSLLKKIEEVEIREKKTKVYLYQKDKTDQMQYYGFVKTRQS